MPFDNCIAHVYTAASVWQSAPSASGLFGISNASGWLYIGDSDDIRGALLNLLESQPLAPGIREAKGFSYELRHPGDRAQRRDRLIQELRPRYSAQAGEGGRRAN